MKNTEIGLRKKITRFILRALARLTGNKWSQYLLVKCFEVNRYLLGIDSGTWVNSSGEFAAVQLAVAGDGKPYFTFDVGANQGQFLEMVTRTIPEAKMKDVVIHSFEPSKRTFDFLKEKAGTLNQLTQIKINNFAMGREVGQATLYTDAVGSEQASLTKRNLFYQGVKFDGEEIVQIETIDNYCKRHEIDHIDLLKIDVEGHELDVLAGANDMLGRKKISAVLFEFNSCNIDTRVFFMDFFLLFEKYNMTIYRITPTGFLWKLPCYDVRYEQFGDSNYLAVSDKII